MRTATTRLSAELPLHEGGARAGPLDATAVLTWYLIVLLGFPAALIFAPLGSAGTPATVLSLGGLLLWGWYHLSRTESFTTHHQPVRIVALVFLLVMVACFAHAMLRPIAAEEVSTATSGLLRLLSLAGVLLVAHDGVTSYDAFHTVLRRIALGGGGLAGLALLQFVTRQPFVDRIQIPGLVWNTPLDVLDRGGFYRVAATATHSIELGVALAMILPLAVTVAFTSTGGRRVLHWGITVAIGLTLFLTISRSAMLSAFVAVAFMLPVWSSRTRRLVLAGGVATSGFVYMLVPGLLGTLLGLFSGVESDPSALSRTNAYAFAFTFVRRSPFLGRGVATFLPPYVILDNEYLLFLIEAGIVGLASLLGLLFTAVLSARAARLLSVSDADRQASQAIGASVAGGACGAVFFDGFSFPIVVGLLFLAVGLCGAALELARKARSQEVLSPMQRPGVS